MDIKKYLTRFLPKKKEVPLAQTNVAPTEVSVEEKLEASTNAMPTSLPQSRRRDDMSAETELAYFLDRYLYRRFPKANAFESIERMHSREQQILGIDVVFKAKDGRTFRVDEKAQLYYLNKDLPTFAFEIEFLRDGTPTIGWLCNPALKTDMYLLVWPFATRENAKGIRQEDFTKADCLLVQKRDVLRFLEEHGLTVERLLRDAKQIRREGKTKRLPIPGVSGIYYYASESTKYREAPINVVISKSHLMEIKQRRYIVTPEKLETE